MHHDSETDQMRWGEASGRTSVAVDDRKRRDDSAPLEGATGGSRPTKPEAIGR